MTIFLRKIHCHFILGETFFICRKCVCKKQQKVKMVAHILLAFKMACINYDRFLVMYRKKGT